MAMQVSVLSMAAMAFDALLGLGAVVGMFLWARRRWGGSMAPFWAGAAAFLLFAMVLESIVHNVVLLGPYGQTIQNNMWLYALYGGLMAGLFEETGRLTAMKLLKKKHNRPQTAFIYGFGHAGIEVIAVLCITMVQNLVLAAMINAGQVQQLMGTVPAEQAEAAMAQLQALVDTAPAVYLLAPVERVSAVIIHITMSVLVWQAVVKPGCFWLYPAAIVLHAAMDGVLVILSRLGMPVLLLEVILLAVTLAMAALVRQYIKRS